MASSAASGFLGRSSNNGSNMRGLVQFIADLRNARARDLEEKRINKELANIRFVPRVAAILPDIELLTYLPSHADRSSRVCSGHGRLHGYTPPRQPCAHANPVYVDGNLNGYHKKKYVCKVFTPSRRR